MKSSGLVSGIYVVSEWVMRFSVINILWAIFNIPNLFIVVSIIFSNQQIDLVILIPILCILLPLFFYPATQALFASMRVFVMNREESENGLIKMYWKFYNENYKNIVLAGFSFTFLWVIWYVDLYFFSENNVILMFVFIVLGVVLYVFTINYFSVGAHYDSRFRQLFKNAFLLTMGSPLLFFGVLVSNGFILLMSIYQFQFLFFFFTGSMIAFLAFSAFYQTTLRLLEK